MIKPNIISVVPGRLAVVSSRLACALMLWVAFAVLAAGAPSGPASAATNRALEHGVKAAYLYKFLTYIDWPADSFPRPDAPFVIGVIGSDDVHRELERITEGRKAAGRMVTVKRLRAGDSLAGVHVLYSGGDELPASATGTRGLLTVTDNAFSVAQARSIINFRVIDGKVRFEVSLPAAERNDLRLSSRMLSVATAVLPGAS